jgi:hypothetical protein
MLGAAGGMAAVNYLTQYTTDAMIEEMWGVDAQDDAWEDVRYRFNASDPGVTDATQYQIGFNDNVDAAKFQWQGTEYENFAYIQRQ